MLLVHTSNPKDIIDKINEYIDHNDIFDWFVDDEGDYTLNSYKDKAWMRPQFDEADKTILRFIIVKNKNIELTKDIYSVFHCELAKVLLNKFDEIITDLYISPLLTDYDNNKNIPNREINNNSENNTKCGQCGYFMRYKNCQGLPEDIGNCGSISMNKECNEGKNPLNEYGGIILEVDINDESCGYFKNKPTKRIKDYIKQHSNLYINK